MKRMYRLTIILAISILILPQTAWAAELLIPGGDIIGLALHDGSVTVAAFDDVLGCCAREGGLCVGDEILKIDGAVIDTTQDVRNAMEKCDGDVELIISRGGRQHRLTLTPVSTSEGAKLGIYLRQGITGIGTVTYYDPKTHTFGSLGHGVSDGKGNLLSMTEGAVYDGQVLSVVKGRSGTPGQLRGSANGENERGILEKNTPQGVFGNSRRGWTGQALPVAVYEEITTGEATIRSTVSGDDIQEYSVEILKIYPEDRSDGRNFLIKVIDPTLLKTTGGIVQGMGVSYNRDNQVNP